jgi:hypothetical protein
MTEAKEVLPIEAGIRPSSVAMMGYVLSIIITRPSDFRNTL